MVRFYRITGHYLSEYTNYIAQMHMYYMENNIAKQIARKVIFQKVGDKQFLNMSSENLTYLLKMFLTNSIFHNYFHEIGIRQTLRCEQLGVVKLPSYNSVMIAKSYILYSFSISEFSLMVLDKIFLMRRYKRKCLDMSYLFSLYTRHICYSLNSLMRFSISKVFLI
jgi:hypothetical protein